MSRSQEAPSPRHTSDTCTNTESYSRIPKHATHNKQVVYEGQAQTGREGEREGERGRERERERRRERQREREREKEKERDTYNNARIIERNNKTCTGLEF